jgi:two-component sensor histidine kinase
MSIRLPPSATLLSDLSSHCFDHSPLPMATVEGTTDILRYVNPAFCRLADQTSDQLLGTPFCAMTPDTEECKALLERIYRSGQPETYAKLASSDLALDPDADPVLSCYAMWPVTANEQVVGVAIQVIEAAPLQERTLAMNEALMLGSLRLHEISADVATLNVQLHAEIGEREQRERDALILTNEIAHRVKNNLQITVALIALEAKSAAAPCVGGYRAMQARIGAIAELYDLISQTSDGHAISLDAYLREIARTMSESLLEGISGIKIEVEAEALEIDPIRAVPLGLLVNELTTNAIKHAFPDRTGRVLLSAQRIGDQIEMIVADNGVGMKDEHSKQIAEKHGSEYVAIFVRQIGGTIALSEAEGTGTVVTIRLPLRVAPQLKGLNG